MCYIKNWKIFTRASDNEAVATVAQNGTVTAKKAGTANITATSKNGKTASCLVRVTDRPMGVKIATATGKAYVDYKKYLQLTATVSPDTA
jgi:alpha-L-fucosidase 2